jgi:cytoskeletal protein CcmA (bactofilin family)
VIVNEHMRVLGTIEGDEDLIVRGRVEGAVRITGSLTVEPGGLVAGDVHARAAQVYGAVYGNVSAIESIEVARSGQLIGDLTAPRVAIVPGAAFRGQVDMRPPALVEAPRPDRALPEPATPAAEWTPPPPPVERERSRKQVPPPERSDRRSSPRGPQPGERPERGERSEREGGRRPVPRLAALGRGPLKRR